MAKFKIMLVANDFVLEKWHFRLMGILQRRFKENIFAVVFTTAIVLVMRGKKKFMRTGLTMGYKPIETDKRDEAVTMVYKGNHMIYW
jgi:hypothetical protein